MTNPKNRMNKLRETPVTLEELTEQMKDRLEAKPENIDAIETAKAYPITRPPQSAVTVGVWGRSLVQETTNQD
jgi:hypothetical protein